MAGAPDEPRAFFGRRKGKKLRQGQDDLVQGLLPRLRIDPQQDPRRQFGRDFQELWLEIGFGGGEHLAAQARAHPDVAFIGCEPFVNGVAKLLAVVAQEGLENVRLWDADATKLLPALPPACIDRAYLLYPDPWPKRRQRKRRFLSDENLRLLARVMRPGAELRFATDIDDYAGWGIARVLRSGDFSWQAERPEDWRRPWGHWPGTRYEAKALHEGRAPSYLTFERVVPAAA